MLDLIEIKRLHDKAYLANQVSREQAANDLIFYWVTQWDDSILQSSQLLYKGEFNILRKAGRQILSDLASNPVEVDFEPINETRQDAAELADGMYRRDSRNNQSIEAYNNAETEMIVCGAAAWELYTKYASRKVETREQIICRRPIMEANNTVFWDPNAVLLDKSDATYVSVLTAYSEDGYKNLVKDLTGEELEKINAETFKSPEESMVFPWIQGKTPKIYVVKFFYREKITDRVISLSDPFGTVIDVWENKLFEVMDELIDSGYSVIDEYDATKYQVTQYLASGKEILDNTVITGEHIPIIPIYGERAIVEGEELWEGITRLAKDPQRLRNFALSYLGDLTSRSPREKPIFAPEQIAGFEDMYSESGVDNNYPYLLANRVTPEGTELPIGPIGTLPGPTIPTPLPALIGLTREACEDVANPGLPQNIADPDISGKAVLALQSRLDMQSMIYQEHLKHGKRRDAEIYISIASEIYDTSRKVMVELPDGVKKQIQTKQTVIDRQTGEITIINDIQAAEFEVFSRMGPSYMSQKEQTSDRIERLIAQTPADDPMRKALMLKYLALMDGVAFEDIRRYANIQLVLSGIKKPETDEEKTILEQAQKQKDSKADPATLIAMAENKKGDAALLKEKREGIKMQLTAANDTRKTDIDTFNAITKRIGTQIDAKETDASINLKDIMALGKQLENSSKLLQPDKLPSSTNNNP